MVKTVLVSAGIPDDAVVVGVEYIDGDRLGLVTQASKDFEVVSGKTIVEHKVYMHTKEHSDLLAARFANGKPQSMSFGFNGHRWAYMRTAFDDNGGYDLIYRYEDVEPTKLQPHHYGALERAISDNERFMKQLLNSDDPYQAMFPEGDAESLKEVLQHLLKLQAT